MNEIWRILKTDGIFFAKTPVYPFQGSFVDPTHNNIMTYTTLKYYFSDRKYAVARHYGIRCSFNIVESRLDRQHLITILRKESS
jgi:hypothetical protein